MIQPNELRIGNYYNRKHGKGWTVTVIDEFIIGEIFSDGGQYTLDEFEPIPLTEEWLMNFGFTIGGSTDTYFQKDDPEILIEKAKGTFYFSWESDWGANNELEVRHVHQLQNLIFALTGIELELKKENV